jgi:hypothetical protein
MALSVQAVGCPSGIFSSLPLGSKLALSGLCPIFFGSRLGSKPVDHSFLGSRPRPAFLYFRSLS